MNTPTTSKNAFASVSVTANPIEPGISGSNDVEFCEVPALFPRFGIRRTKAFQAIKEGWIKSVLLRVPGNRSGKRLVHVESVRQWLKSQMEMPKS